MLCRVNLTDTSERVVLDKDGGGKGDFCGTGLDSATDVSSDMGSGEESSSLVRGGVSMFSIGSSGCTLVSGSFAAKSFSLGCGGVGVEVDVRGSEGEGVRGWEGVGVRGWEGEDARVWEEVGASSDGDSTGERNKSESSSLGRGVVMAREVVTREEGWEGA